MAVYICFIRQLLKTALTPKIEDLLFFGHLHLQEKM